MSSEHSPKQIVASNALRTALLPHAFPALISLALLIDCVVSTTKRLFWFDEMLTYYMASETSFSHMFAGIKSTFNAFPPLYNIAIWIWARVWGTSELALRLPSSLCFAGALWVLWLTLRPRFGTAPTCLGISAALLSRYVDYNSQARGYSLYLLFCALTIYQFARWTSQPKRAWTFYAANTLFHACMVLTHSFGFLYSACLLLVALYLDVKKRRFSVSLYGSVLLGWGLFALLWLKPLLYQISLFKPYSWVSVPGLKQLIGLMLTDDRRLLVMMVIGIAACVILARLSKHQSQFSPSAFQNDTWRSLSNGGESGAKTLALLAGIFLIVPPLVVYVISHLSTSVFVQRYFLPSILAWAILLTFVSSELQFRLGVWRKVGIEQGPRLLVGTALVLLLIFIIKTVRSPKYPIYGMDLTSLPEAQGIPMVCDNYLSYLVLFHYSPEGSRYCFLLDEEACLKSAPQDLGWQMVEYKMMLGLHQHYPLLSVMDWKTFLRTHDRFLVITDSRCQWENLRLRSNPQYACKDTVREGLHLLWVRKIH